MLVNTLILLILITTKRFMNITVYTRLCLHNFKSGIPDWFSDLLDFKLKLQIFRPKASGICQTHLRLVKAKIYAKNFDFFSNQNIHIISSFFSVNLIKDSVSVSGTCFSTYEKTYARLLHLQVS